MQAPIAETAIATAFRIASIAIAMETVSPIARIDVLMILVATSVARGAVLFG